MRQRLLWVYESIEAVFLVILSNINAVWLLPCLDIFEWSPSAYATDCHGFAGLVPLKHMQAPRYLKQHVGQLPVLTCQVESLSWVNPELCDESWQKKASIPTDKALANAFKS